MRKEAFGMTIPFRHMNKAVLALLIGILITACATAPGEKGSIAPDPSILRVGVSSDAPPLIYRQNEKITGLEAELAANLAEYLNKTAVFVELAWDQQIPALVDNRIDIIMSGMSITPARQYQIAFSKPYFKSGLMILVKDLPKYAFIKTPETVLAQSITWRIGVVKDTTGEAFIRQKSTGAKAIRAYENQDAALSDLIAGRIDVFVYDAPMVLRLAVLHQSEGVRPLPVMLNEEYLAWGIAKSNPDLLASVNEFIEHANRQGQMQTIIKRWIPLAQ